MRYRSVIRDRVVLGRARTPHPVTLRPLLSPSRIQTLCGGLSEPGSLADLVLRSCSSRVLINDL